MTEPALDREVALTPPLGRGQQIIPRPPVWSLGPKAPWPAGTTPSLPDVLRSVSDVSRPLLPAFSDALHSAVLVLLTDAGEGPGGESRAAGSRARDGR